MDTQRSRTFSKLRLVGHYCSPPCGNCPPIGITYEEYLQAEARAATREQDDQPVHHSLKGTQNRSLKYADTRHYSK
jgi:hypothetical protein